MCELFDQLHHACTRFAGPARSVANLMRANQVRQLNVEGCCYELTDHGLVITKAAHALTVEGEPNPQRCLPI